MEEGPGAHSACLKVPQGTISVTSCITVVVSRSHIHCQVMEAQLLLPKAHSKMLLWELVSSPQLQPGRSLQIWDCPVLLHAREL